MVLDDFLHHPGKNLCHQIRIHTVLRTQRPYIRQLLAFPVRIHSLEAMRRLQLPHPGSQRKTVGQQQDQTVIDTINLLSHRQQLSGDRFVSHLLVLRYNAAWGGKYKPFLCPATPRSVAYIDHCGWLALHLLSATSPTKAVAALQIARVVPYPMSMLAPVPAISSSVLRLAVPSPLRRLFDYLPPQGMSEDCAQRLQPGTRIRVNFGNRELVGVLISVAGSSAVPMNKLKPAMAVLDSEPILPPALMRLFEWAVSYYQHPPGEVFMNMLPALLRRGDAPVHEAVLQWRLSEAGMQLTCDDLKRAPRQREIVEFLREHGQLDRESLTELGISTGALRSLEQAALVCTVATPAHELTITTSAAAEQSHPLNAEQQAAVDAITAAGGFDSLLLDGVTG